MSDTSEARDRLKGGFSAVAREYVNGRPRYSPEVVAQVLAGLPRPSEAIDVGAGSGQLAIPLARAGARVTAVEPLDSARALLVASAREAGVAVRVVAGGAEALPCRAGSMDLVTVADAFHWFEPAAAVAEFVRVLRPGGRCCVSMLQPVWTEEQSGEWAREIGDLVIPIWVAAKHPLGGMDQMEDQLVHAQLGPVSVDDVLVVHHTDRSGLADYFSSISVVGVLADEERAAFRAQVEAVLADHHVGAIALDYNARVWTTARL